MYSEPTGPRRAKKRELLEVLDCCLPFFLKEQGAPPQNVTTCDGPQLGFPRQFATFGSA